MKTVLDSQKEHKPNKDTRNELMFMQVHSRQPNLERLKTRQGLRYLANNDSGHQLGFNPTGYYKEKVF